MLARLYSHMEFEVLFLVVVGLRSLFLCQMSGRDFSQILEVALIPCHIASSYLKSAMENLPFVEVVSYVEFLLPGRG